eukprot:scaffold3474_cov111-Isochrysis_galbana.AAC.1
MLYSGIIACDGGGAACVATPAPDPASASRGGDRGRPRSWGPRRRAGAGPHALGGAATTATTESAVAPSARPRRACQRWPRHQGAPARTTGGAWRRHAPGGAAALARACGAGRRPRAV